MKFLIAGAENYSRDKQSRMTEENFSMMKTIIIAVCSAVAYLAVVIGLTVYCSIRLVKAKNLRKMANDTQPVQTGGMTNHGKYKCDIILDIFNEHSWCSQTREYAIFINSREIPEVISIRLAAIT